MLLVVLKVFNIFDFDFLFYSILFSIRFTYFTGGWLQEKERL